jgi:hypothetical protein
MSEEPAAGCRHDVYMDILGFLPTTVAGAVIA